MSGRFIGTNVCSIHDMIDHMAKKSLPGLVLFLDFRKAFDMVSHPFLFTLLSHIGLPEEFVAWTKIMYHGAVSVVRHNNWLTQNITLNQGVQQGCLLSCHLFNLVGQVLIFYLHDNRFFR